MIFDETPPHKTDTMEDENFNKDLHDLFVLFKKLLEREAEGELPGVQSEQMEQLKALMARMDEIKDNLSSQNVQMDPFTKMMISSVVKQLRDELGPVTDDDLVEDMVEETPQLSSAEEIVRQREELLSDVSDPTARNRALVETIDEQLRNPNLSDEEIDALLDKRRQISANL